MCSQQYLGPPSCVSTNTSVSNLNPKKIARKEWTDEFKFLLLRIKGNVQSLDIFLVLLSPLVQLGHRHLLGRALLLEFVDLSPEFADLLV